jgi:hypothetical protein
MSRGELMEKLRLKDRMHFRMDYLQPALAAALIEMTIPDKPRSSKQKYRLTDKGRQALGERRKGRGWDKSSSASHVEGANHELRPRPKEAGRLFTTVSVGAINKHCG